MKLKYHAHACFSMQFDCGTKLVLDPFDASVTYPPCTESCDAVIVSHDHFDHNHTATLSGEFETIRTAGEFDVGGVHIHTLPCFHDKERGALRGENLISIIEGDGLHIAHLGDLGHMPDEALAAQLANIDVMLLPIGGTFTIDTPEAEALIAQLKPRVAIGMHFRTDEYEINITTCEAFRRDMHAVSLPSEIEITAESIGKLPPAIIMSHK